MHQLRVSDAMSNFVSSIDFGVIYITSSIPWTGSGRELSCACSIVLRRDRRKAGLETYTIEGLFWNTNPASKHTTEPSNIHIRVKEPEKEERVLRTLHGHCSSPVSNVPTQIMPV